MCGRFNVIDSPGLQDLLRDLGIDLQLPSAVNIAPTEQVALVCHGAQGAQLQSARWWLTPSWSRQVDQKYAMFNARSESLSSKSAYKKPFRSQRGIVPMSSFVEWRMENGVKVPWRISTESAAMAAAAVWDVWTGGEKPLLSCSVVTTAAAKEFTPWHSRMPVLLTGDESLRWLDNRSVIEDNDEIFRSELKLPLQLLPLSREAGNSRNKAPSVMDAIGEGLWIGR